MDSLEDSVDRKYVATKDASDWEVMTDTGWEQLNTVSKTISYEVWEIKTATKALKCADNHILFYKGFEQVFVKDIEVGEFIVTKDGLEEVISVENLHFSDNMYDLDINNLNKRFFTDGILSHNSTIIGLYCLWNVIFADARKPIEIWILSNKGASAQSFLDDIKGTYEELDPYLKCGMLEYNKTSITFENGSKIITGTTSKDTIRGESPAVVILDEFAHVPAHIAEEFFTAVSPTIATGGKMIIISTPNGNSGKFYDIFTNAKDGPDGNGFVSFSMAWNEVPGRDEAFKQREIKKTSLQKWNQEYEAKFLGSSNTLINGDALERMGKLIEEPVIDNEGFIVWEKPNSKHIYVLSCDVAKGVQKDNSAIQILNVTNPKLVTQAALWFSNEIDPYDFAEKINEIGNMYFKGFVIVENNTYGHEVARRLFDQFQYENLYKERKSKQWGICSGARTKSIATSILKRKLENRELVIKDAGTYKELCDFVEVAPDVYRNSSKYGRDDKVMCLVWGCYFLESDYWKEWSEYLRNVASGSEQSNEQELNEIYDPIVCDDLIEDDNTDDGWLND